MIQSVLICLAVAASVAVCPCAALEQLRLQSCSQSSVVVNGTCNKAIDNFINGTDPEANCSMLGNETGGWWRAVTKRTAFIQLISIFNRVDCCMDSLNDFAVTVDGVECISHKSEESFMNKTFMCGWNGHAIQIFSKRPKLTLCEVRVFGEYVNNDGLLSFTSCSQSSTVDNSTTERQECMKMMDGNVAQTPASSCSLLGNFYGRWEASFAPRMVFIKRVLIYTTVDKVPGYSFDRMTDFTITKDQEWWTPCLSYGDALPFSVKSFSCYGIATSITITNRGRLAALCEVQIIGEYLDTNYGEILELANCSQSSTLQSPLISTYQCFRATDTRMYPPIVDSVCCSSTATANGWWRASTGCRAFISLVNIYNVYLPAFYTVQERSAGTGLDTFALTLDGMRCAFHDSTEFWMTRVFECYQVGQQFEISSGASTNLVICEVQVVGFYVDIQEELSWKDCSQSYIGALYGSHNSSIRCDSAMDGAKDSRKVTKRPSCCHVAEALGWWRANLIRWSYIERIRMYLVKTINESIEVEDEYGIGHFEANVDQRDQCNFHASNRYSSYVTGTFNCGLIGTIVTIKSPNYGMNLHLTLCDVQVHGQYLKDEKQLELSNCQQSSGSRAQVPNSPFNECNLAIDGEGRQPSSCTAIPRSKPWWQAETERLAYIKRVRIFSRVDLAGRASKVNLTDFVITVDGQQCASYNSTAWPYFTVKVFPCHAVGRVVRIANEKPDITLCEVEVFGKFIDKEELIPLSSCVQSSTFQGMPHATCDKAIDGVVSNNVTSGSCAYGGDELGWWRAETGRRVRVKRVRVATGVGTQPDERRSHFAIKVDYDVCAVSKDDPSQTRDFFCDQIGHTITIASYGPLLVICEVQVFGDTRVNEPHRLLETVLCRPDYPTYSRYHCNELPRDQLNLPPTGPLSCNLTGNYTLAGMDSVPLGFFDTPRSAHRDSLEYTGWFRAMTYEPSYIRTVNIGLKSFNSTCYQGKFREFLIAVDAVPCASYSIYRSKEKYDEAFRGRGMNFTCNAVGHVVEIATRDPCTIDVSEVTVYGEDIRNVDTSTKEWSHPLCTRQYLHQVLDARRGYNRNITG